MTKRRQENEANGELVEKVNAIVHWKSSALQISIQSHFLAGTTSRMGRDSKSQNLSQIRCSRFESCFSAQHAPFYSNCTLWYNMPDARSPVICYNAFCSFISRLLADERIFLAECIFMHNIPVDLVPPVVCKHLLASLPRCTNPIIPQVYMFPRIQT